MASGVGFSITSRPTMAPRRMRGSGSFMRRTRVGMVRWSLREIDPSDAATFPLSFPLVLAMTSVREGIASA